MNTCGLCARLGVTLVGLLGFCPIADAKIVYVAETGSDANNGLSWSMAKVTVQAGLNSATAGDEVWVAEGTYLGEIILTKGVALYGGFSGLEVERVQRDWRVNETILDRTSSGNVVTVPAGATSATRIDGFTIRDGRLVTCAKRCTGIYCSTSSSPTIANNTLVAIRSSGVFCDKSSSPLILANTITGCFTPIECIESTPTISSNVITRNSGPCGGVYCYLASPTIVNNIIAGNSSSYAGAICCQFSSATIVNNTIVGNSSPVTGGIYCEDGPLVTITNNIVAFNSSGVAIARSEVTLRSNCVYGNLGFDYSGVADPTGTDGNISIDPGLANPLYGNAHLQPGSPCIDAGDDNVVQSGWTDVDLQARVAGSHVDIGADESDGTTWSNDPPAIVRVDSGGDDGNDGFSWTSAKRTVQAGIDAAATRGGEVWVKAGTYAERITLPTYVYLYGGFRGTETQREQRDWRSQASVLDGKGGGPVVTASQAGYAMSTVDGFVIRNADGTSAYGVYCKYVSPIIRNNTITSNRESGLVCYLSSPFIADNTIAGNACYGIQGSNAFTVIRGNRITGNGTSVRGGGISCYNIHAYPAIIENNVITGNTGVSWGGGIYCGTGPTWIVGNIISRNTAPRGGGLYLEGSGTQLAGNTITGNIAGVGGGGIYCGNCSPTITNNVVAGNSAPEGSAIDCQGSSYPKIVGNTIVGNTSTQGGVIDYSSLSSPRITNTIIAFNSPGLRCSQGTPTLRFNCVYGNASYDYSGIADPTGTYGNISVNPLFVRNPGPGADGTWGTEDDPGDLHLSVRSLCIDAGENKAVPAGILTDRDGSSRFFNDLATPDTGLGTAPIVDMGAYEFVPGDLDHDGDCDADDMKAFAACVSGPAVPCSGDCAKADFDRDGDVDQSDFGFLQRSFSESQR